MRILVLVHEYPPVGGGGGRVAEDICQGLVRRGHVVRILTSHLKGLPSHANHNGVEVLRLRSGRRFAYRATFASMVLFIINGFFAGLREILQFKPDVMHVHFAVPAGALAWALSFLTGVPYVLTAHLGDVPGGVPEKTDKWFRLVFPFTPPIWKRARRVAAVSEFTRELALSRYPVAIEMIPNGVSLTEYDPGAIVVNTPPQLVFAGRFMPQKNPLQVVEVLAGLTDLSWKAVMVGDGPLKRDIEGAIQRSGLQERLALPGWLTPAEVKQYFSQSDILFMPSLSEGLPVVGVQAMAMGLALVVGRTGGFIDLVEPEVNGFLCDPMDKEAIIAALRTILTDRDKLRQQREASRRMAKKYELDHIVERYETLLLGAIQ